MQNIIFMNRILYSVVALSALLASCSEQFAESYFIQGATSVASLDQKKLYLKAYAGEGQGSIIDSCEVVHGGFTFTGKLDTISMAELSTIDGGLPVVLEKGNITVNIERTGRRVSGSPQNETLYDFLEKHLQLENQIKELDRKETQMIFDGVDQQTIAKVLTAEGQLLMMRIDSLETRFIIDNSDNILGPYVFCELTRNYSYPVMTPQIEEIMFKATEKFKKNPYVSTYCKNAQDILARMKGETDHADKAPAAANEQ